MLNVRAVRWDCQYLERTSMFEIDTHAKYARVALAADLNQLMRDNKWSPKKLARKLGYAVAEKRSKFRVERCAETGQRTINIGSNINKRWAIIKAILMDAESGSLRFSEDATRFDDATAYALVSDIDIYNGGGDVDKIARATGAPRKVVQKRVAELKSFLDSEYQELVVTLQI